MIMVNLLGEGEPSLAVNVEHIIAVQDNYYNKEWDGAVTRMVCSGGMNYYIRQTAAEVHWAVKKFLGIDWT